MNVNTTGTSRLKPAAQQENFQLTAVQITKLLILYFSCEILLFVICKGIFIYPIVETVNEIETKQEHTLSRGKNTLFL